MAAKYFLVGIGLTLQIMLTLAYVVPKARFEVLHPKGFAVSIPDTPGIQIFAFHGNLNSPMEGLEAGQFSADITKHKNGRWTFTDRKHEIKPGDIMYYWLYVQKDSLGYRRDDQRHEFTETDVFGNNNATEESVTESTEKAEFITKPPKPPGTITDNCNASTPPLRVHPQEIHHHHHHYLPNMPNSDCPTAENPSTSGGFVSSVDKETIRQLTLQLRDIMITVESMKLKVATLSDVVDELINSGGSGTAKLLLTGAKLDSSTNLFELVRHVILDRLELKDLKNDIYSATRTKEGVVFDVASGLDKRRILAKARERFTENDELRIQDYYDPDVRSGATGGAIGTNAASEPLIDVRFGDE